MSQERGSNEILASVQNRCYTAEDSHTHSSTGVAKKNKKKLRNKQNNGLRDNGSN
jgi:hypothetical protein